MLEVLKNVLNISYPQADALNVWMLNTGWVESKVVGTCVALLVYGVYNAFNTIKKKGITNSMQAKDCIKQHCKNGVMGHPSSTQILNSCWQRPIKCLC